MLHEEGGRPDVDREETVEVFDGLILDRGGLGNTGVRDKYVQPLSEEGANLRGDRVRAIGCGEVGGDSVGPPPVRISLTSDWASSLPLT